MLILRLSVSSTLRCGDTVNTSPLYGREGLAFRVHAARRLAAAKGQRRLRRVALSLGVLFHLSEFLIAMSVREQISRSGDPS